MSEHPKRENYDSDSDFLDAMADHYGIDRRMLRHIPIPKMTHDDDACPHLVRANLLEAENARLKAAFDLLDESIKLGPSTIPVSRGYYFWKESEQYFIKAENARLKAQVERLTKANKWLLGQGNHMCDSLEESGKDECLTQSWREITAKEGKQS